MVLDEVTNYEARLIDGWKERFTIMREGLPANCDGSMISAAARTQAL